jgi:hypothetical protein
MVFVIEEWLLKDPIQSFIKMNVDNREEDIKQQMAQLQKAKQDILQSLENIQNIQNDKIKSLTNINEEQTSRDRKGPIKGFGSTTSRRRKRVSKDGDDS